MARVYRDVVTAYDEMKDEAGKLLAGFRNPLDAV